MKIKICGATSVEEIMALEEAGAAYAGIWTGISGDRRSVPDSLFPVLAERCQAVRPVAVCVSRPIDQLLALLQASRVSHVQLHGFNMPRDVARLSACGFNVIKTLHVADDGTSPEARWIDKYAQAGCSSFLIDRYAGPHMIGSGGKVLPDWVIRQWVRRLSGHQIWLAGGLTPDRISELAQENLVDVADVDSAARESGLISYEAAQRLVSASRPLACIYETARVAKSHSFV